ncbi:MAG: hypothetical protein K0R17_3631 [Rariglobus sp.]|nr:hypothetical protein [Rariglobus sp.]
MWACWESRVRKKVPRKKRGNGLKIPGGGVQAVFFRIRRRRVRRHKKTCARGIAGRFLRNCEQARSFIPDFRSALRDSAENRSSILLGLEARSGVAAFGHLPLVNSLAGSWAGVPIPAQLWRFIFVRIPYFFLKPSGFWECHFQAVATMGSIVMYFGSQPSSLFAFDESA